MTCVNYNCYSFCVICRIKQPIIRRLCESCGRLVRHKCRTYKGRKTFNGMRYGIAFIPTAIIVLSNLYNVISL